MCVDEKPTEETALYKAIKFLLSEKGKKILIERIEKWKEPKNANNR